MEAITWNDFEKVQLVCGTIVEAEVFLEARKPAYKNWGLKNPALRSQSTIHPKNWLENRFLQ
jgi:hypothetical protein